MLEIKTNMFLLKTQVFTMITNSRQLRVECLFLYLNICSEANKQLSLFWLSEEVF